MASAKPKVMCIDTSEDVLAALAAAGFNVIVGSFGSPQAQKGDGLCYPVSIERELLNEIGEQEILLIDLSRSPKAIAGGAAKAINRGDPAVGQVPRAGRLDPRPLAMRTAQESCERILAYGGMFIVFLGTRYTVDYLFGKTNSHGYVEGKDRKTISSWSFLPQVDSLDSDNQNGAEITFLDALLDGGGSNATYSTTIAAKPRETEHWQTIARNKYGHTVGAIWTHPNTKGRILVLPSMPAFHTIAVDVLLERCAEWNPDLFPEHGAFKWLEYEEYEVPAVNRIRHAVRAAKERAAQEVGQLEGEIEALRANNANWYALLRGTGRELVVAVMESLKELGFTNVIDVDAIENSASLREDLQILDSEPPLIVDVKGVNGTPADPESTQSEKHSLMRGREWSKYCQPLTIINSQRKLPPYERDRIAYRQEIIANAERTGLGLMTSWDLFGLLRNAKELNWPAECVKPIFYRTGRLQMVPTHYSSLGTIEKAWEHSIAIVVQREVRVGDRIAIQDGYMFRELAIESIHLNDAPVAVAEIGVKCGLGFGGVRLKWKEGSPVFFVEVVR